MTREEYNARYPHVAPTDRVQCDHFGQGREHDHYDRRCSPCYHGHNHTWREHDESIRVYEDMS